MSRSRRKTPIFGITTAESDKPFKVQEHRAERRTLRARLSATLDSDNRRLYAQPYGNPWGAPKDGKQFWGGATERDMRK